MDNAQKAIMIGVGLFLTIALITAVLFVTGIGQNLLNSASGNISDIADQQELQLYSAYNDTDISGDQALTALDQYRNSNKIGVYVNGKGVASVGKYDLKSAKLEGTFYVSDKKPADLATISTRDDCTASVDKRKTYHANLVVYNGHVVGIHIHNK